VSTGERFERFERFVLVAGSGIGAALARRIAGRGVALMLHARGADDAARARLAAVAAECEQRGATCATAYGNLAGPGNATALVEATLTHFGTVEQIVANPGHAQRQTLAALDAASLEGACAAMRTARRAGRCR